MDTRITSRLIFHGAVVILLGLAAGFPFALVQLGSMVGSERAWRMAHLEGVLNGLLMIAIAGVGPQLRLTTRQGTMLGWSLIITGYGNVVASVIGASFSVRGLAAGGSLANTVVYLLFLAAVLTVVVAMLLVARGARRSGPRA